MEWKIGEIRQVNGEWCQCVEGTCCKDCVYNNTEDCIICNTELHKCLSNKRSDGKDVIFMKLEKVGEPYRRWLSPSNNIMVQRYRLYGRNVIMPDEPCMYFNAIDNTIEIEIKQTKEDMEEKKLNLKPFDIQKAKEGKQVCTRDGRKARIICFNRESIGFPIIALVKNGDTEGVYQFDDKGRSNIDDEERGYDLMMLSEKKEGWVNVYRDCDGVNITKDDNIYSSKDSAIASAQVNDRDNYVDTVKICWEE